jgi:hypothetical protein
MGGGRSPVLPRTDRTHRTHRAEDRHGRHRADPRRGAAASAPWPCNSPAHGAPPSSARQANATTTTSATWTPPSPTGQDLSTGSEHSPHRASTPPAATPSPRPWNSSRTGPGSAPLQPRLPQPNHLRNNPPHCYRACGSLTTHRPCLSNRVNPTTPAQPPTSKPASKKCRPRRPASPATRGRRATISSTLASRADSRTSVDPCSNPTVHGDGGTVHKGHKALADSWRAAPDRRTPVARADRRLREPLLLRLARVVDAARGPAARHRPARACTWSTGRPSWTGCRTGRTPTCT